MPRELRDRLERQAREIDNLHATNDRLKGMIGDLEQENKRLIRENENLTAKLAKRLQDESQKEKDEESFRVC